MGKRIFVVAILAFANLQAAEFYLRLGAVDGNGTKDSPFGSFEVAQKAVRKAVADPTAQPGSVVVTVLDGSYFIDKPVRFTKYDSGTALHPVVWRAQTRGGVRFTGGISVPKLEKLSHDDPNWSRIPERARSHVSVADLKAAGITDYGVVKANGVGGPYMELVWDGRFQTLARWPNDGWTGVEHGVVCHTNIVESFQYSDERVSRWTDEPAPYGNGFFAYNWHADRVAFEKIDPSTKTIWQKGRGSIYGYFKTGFWLSRAGLWYGYNLLCELDAPGEYYIDRERGRLYFWPPSARKDTRASNCELTITDSLFGLSGVSLLGFEGFRIENCRNKAVALSGCSDIRFAACSFANMGDKAVTAFNSRNCRIVGCDIAWCGEGGISIQGGDGKTLSHGNLVVENCHIHHFALMSLAYAPAVQTWGCGNAVRNCTIHDGPHAAIIFWGREHEFLRNEIHSVCLDCGEMGAIYTGRDFTFCGNRVEANYIHDIYVPRGEPNRGVMLDDSVAGITVSSNVFVRVGEGVSLASIGNAVENNLFVSNFPPISAWSNFAAPGVLKNPYWANGERMCRLAGLPVHEEPWKTKYPYLGLLDDAIKTGDIRDPATRTSIRRNMSVGGTTNLVHFQDKAHPKQASRYVYTPTGWLIEDNAADVPPNGFARLLPLSNVGVQDTSERFSWPISHPVTIKCSNLVYKNKKER